MASSRGLFALAALLLVAGAAVAVLLLGGGGESAPSTGETRARQTTTESTTTNERRTRPASAPAAVAVRDFYRSAADGRTDKAWDLATPNARAIFGSRERFDGTFSTLESISFRRLEVSDQKADTATVALSTVAKHTNRTDRCSGTARTVKSDGRWLVDGLNVSCSSG